eukprot:scaffold6425_cov63-Phaeocystis_antarctica.AAC.2
MQGGWYDKCALHILRDHKLLEPYGQLARDRGGHARIVKDEQDASLGVLRVASAALPGREHEQEVGALLDALDHSELAAADADDVSGLRREEGGVEQLH